MNRRYLLAVCVAVAILIIALVAARRSGRGGAGGGKGSQSYVFADGQSVSASSTPCPSGSAVVLNRATYSSPGGKSMDVTAKAQSLFNTGAPFTVSAAALGAPPPSGGAGSLSVSVALCSDAASSSRSGFVGRVIGPFGSCAREDYLDYGVASQTPGGLALVWSPYVAGSEYQLKKDPSAKREGFEPVPCLPCGGGPIPLEGDERLVDSNYSNAPDVQPLLYSSIAPMPPARGVTSPLETEPETTVTHLSANGRVLQMADPYLPAAAKFGRSVYEIPPGDPGYMVPVMGASESFVPKKQGRLTSLTGGRRGPPSRSSGDVSRLSMQEDGGINDQESTRGFGRAPIANRPRRR